MKCAQLCLLVKYIDYIFRRLLIIHRQFRQIYTNRIVNFISTFKYQRDRSKERNRDLSSVIIQVKPAGFRKLRALTHCNFVSDTVATRLCYRDMWRLLNRGLSLLSDGDNCITEKSSQCVRTLTAQ